jgi:K+-sensing histidine kinase KdpD/CheY-like chemotaxis protein
MKTRQFVFIRPGKLINQTGLLLIFWCLSYSLHAQKESEKGLPFITNYSAKTFNALPQTWCVQQDENGMMYFGIQNYILEYDGLKWRKLLFQNNISSNVCRSMAKSEDGVIYYGAFGDIGYLSNDSIGQKRTYSLLDLVPAQYRNFLDVWSTYTTESGIYFQSREYIFRYDYPKAGSKTKQMMKVWAPRTKFMYAFYLDGDYFVHQQGEGLYKMVNDSLVLIPGSEFLGKERMQIMLPYKKTASGENQYLIGLFYSGLYLFDGHKFQPFATKADPIIKSGYNLYKGIQLNNGNYVLSTTGKGLVIIDAQGNLLQKINRDVGLQDESIYAEFIDKKGSLWLALDNGISRVEIASPLTKFGLQSGITTGVLSINRLDGNLYIGMSNGLLAFNNNTAVFEPVPGMPGSQVFNLVNVGNEMLVPGDGLFSVKNKKATTVEKSVGADLTLNGVYHSKKYPNILLGIGNFGVAVFQNQPKVSSRDSLGNWHFEGYIPGIKDQLWGIAENADGTIWAGTAVGRSYLVTLGFDETGNIDLKNAKFEIYGPEHGYKNGLGIMYSIKGTIYFIGDSAIYTFDDKLKRFKVDSTFGLFGKGGGNTEFDMDEDKQGRVWIRFGKEIRLAIPKPGGGYNIDTTFLREVSELTIQKIYPEENGIVWLCTTDGLIRFDENIEKENDPSFKSLIRLVSAGKSLLNTSTSSGAHPFEISYQDNTLRFEYAAPFYVQEEKTVYQTWLEGFEKGWSEWGNNYYKEFTNLPHGNYKFHVRAMNIYQKVSDEAVYDFTINPPLFQTWWAYLLYAIAGFSIIYLVVRYRTKQLHEKHRELEKTVSERTHELSQRVEELAVINSVQEALVSALDMQAIYNLVGDRIREVFNAQAVIIATFDHEAGVEHFRYTIENGERFYPNSRQLDKLRKQLIQTRQKIVIRTAQEAFTWFGKSTVEGTKPLKSGMFVPLIIGDKITSYISLQNVDREEAFTDSDIRLLETLANSMSVALENARLFDETTRLLKETEQRTAELAVINSVQDGLAKELDMQGIYKLIGDRLCSLFPDTETLVIRTFDHEKYLEHFHYVIENGVYLKIDPRPFIWESKQLIQTKKPLYIHENYAEVSKEYGESAVTEGEPVKSAIFVPMMVGDMVKGTISLQNVTRENAFSESDIRLLTTLTNSMSVALENARLFDETNRLLKETEQRTAELAVINSVQEGLVREMDMQGIYDLVGDRVQKLFSAQAVIIASFDLTNKTEHFNYLFENGEKFKPGPRPVNEMRQMLIDKKRTIYIETEEKAKTEYGITAIEGTKMPKSLLFVPLLAGNDIRGYVSLQNIDIEHAFSDSDIRLLETLANSMTVALENARLFEETNRLLKETEQRKAELAVINSVQEGLVREMDLQAIYDLMGNRLCELFNTQTVLIRTFDYETGTENWRYAIERGERLYSKPRPMIWANQELVNTKKYILINENYLEIAKSHGGSGVSKGLPPKSALFVPMIVGDNVRGSVSLQNVEMENAFSESDVRLLSTLANSMSVALENARLFEETKLLLAETEKGKKNVELLSDIGKKITASLDFETIFYKLYEHINQLADATIFGVGIYHPDLDQVEYKFAIEKGKRYKPYSRDTTDKNQLPVWCIENRMPVFINDLPKEYSRYIRKYDTKEILLEDGSVSTDPLSLIYLPLIVKGQVLGIITIQSFQKNAYTDYHLNLLQNLATYTSIALDNAKAYRQLNEREQEIGQRAAELSTVNSISQAMASQLDPDELINLVGSKMRDLFRANIVYVAMLDHKSKIISFPYQYGDNLEPMKLGEGLTSQILLTGKPLLINKDVKEQTDKLGLQRIGLPAASYLGVPIPVGDEIIGVLSIQTTEAENRFNENDQRLLSTIATSVGVALRKAKLFEEVQHAKMEAEAARKNAEKANEAKSAFLSTVSHELRTPLTSVLGFAKIIRKRLEEKIFPLTDKTDIKTSKTIQQVSENLAVVVSEGERLTTLINDVLDLAKIEAGKMEWNFENVSMPEIAERAVAATSSLFDQKSLVLEKHIETDLPFINGDKDKLIQVIVNLISNAVKFTPTGTITCNVSKKGNEIIVGITDTGIGIAKEDFKAVFEQFRQVGGDTLTDKPKGTGLGLPICKEIVEHHGGRIWLESEQGKGSAFFFALPLTNANAIKPMHLDDLVKQLKVQMAQSQLHIKGKNITILVVDDDDSIRSLLQQEFTEAGYNVEEANNGKQALERIRDNRPDLIILDIMMPEMNGFDVAAILKNDPQTMDIPIIVLSIVQDKARGYRIGVDRYLTKPIDTAALFAEVGTLLEQGKSSKKVMVVDEDSAAVKTLTDVLQAKGYMVVESDGKELMEKAISAQPDIIILNSVLSGKQEIVQSLRFEKGLENVLFLIYQ